MAEPNNKVAKALGCILIGALTTSTAMADTLEQSITNALATNPSLQQAVYGLRATIADRDVARGGYYATISVDGGIGYEDTQYLSGNKIDEQLDRKELGLTLSQPLFRGFETKYSVEKYGHSVEASKLELRASAEEKAFEVADVYLNLILAEKMLELSRLNQVDHEKIREDIQLKVTSQLAAPADLAQVDARLANARSSTIAAQNRVFDLRNKYRIIVGKGPMGLIEPKPIYSALPPTLEEANARARQSNHQIKAAKRETKASNADYQATKSGYYPDVTLELTTNYDDDTGGVPGKDQNSAAMIMVNYDLYDGSKRSNRKRASAYRYQQSLEQVRSIERDIALEVETAWYAVKLLEEQAGYLKANVTAAAKAEDGYQEQFKVGRRELLDVLISKTETFRARQSYLDAYYRQLIAVYRLKWATGELLNTLEIEVPQQWSAAQ